MKYRLKLYEVEAIKVLGPDFNGLSPDGPVFDVKQGTMTPGWLMRAVMCKELSEKTPFKIEIVGQDRDYAKVVLKKYDGPTQEAQPGDYIIHRADELVVIAEKDFETFYEASS